MYKLLVRYIFLRTAYICNTVGEAPFYEKGCWMLKADMPFIRVLVDCKSKNSLASYDRTYIQFNATTLKILIFVYIKYLVANTRERPKGILHMYYCVVSKWAVRKTTVRSNSARSFSLFNIQQALCQSRTNALPVSSLFSYWWQVAA